MKQTRSLSEFSYLSEFARLYPTDQCSVEHWVCLCHSLTLPYVIFQSERDIMIWNNKKYTGKPVFAKSKEDALLTRFRRWYSQFYSEHSPRLTLQKDTLEW